MSVDNLWGRGEKTDGLAGLMMTDMARNRSMQAHAMQRGWRSLLPLNAAMIYNRLVHGTR